MRGRPPAPAAPSAPATAAATRTAAGAPWLCMRTGGWAVVRRSTGARSAEPRRGCWRRGLSSDRGLDPHAIELAGGSMMPRAPQPVPSGGGDPRDAGAPEPGRNVQRACATRQDHLRGSRVLRHCFPASVVARVARVRGRPVAERMSIPRVPTRGGADGEKLRGGSTRTGYMSRGHAGAAAARPR
eukprot:361871-Chlamydomonas_euryale.AAC.3